MEEINETENLYVDDCTLCPADSSVICSCITTCYIINANMLKNKCPAVTHQKSCKLLIQKLS